MFYIKHQQRKDARELANKISRWLKKKEANFTLEKGKPDKDDIVVAVGNDNFILKLFSSLGKSQPALLAISPLQSFFAQGSLLNYENCLKLLIKNKYAISKRARLVCKINKTESPLALNDIGLFPSKSATLLKYNLIINNETFWKDTADGIIVSTPTGSTGYALSAHGPIILNEPKILAITPIASMERHSPLIISDDTNILITGIKGFSPIVVIDGDIRIPVKSDRIEIKKSEYYANFIQLSKYSLESKLKKRTIGTDLGKLKGLPPSAKLIYKLLAYEGNMTQKEIIESSFLPERTVRHALAILISHGLISQQPYLSDARQSVYGV